MAENSLGYFAITPGTRVRATASRTDPTAAVWATSFVVQQLPASTANIYVGGPAVNVASGADVFRIVAEPTATNAAPWVQFLTGDDTRDLFDMSSIYLDADGAGGQCLISYVET